MRDDRDDPFDEFFSEIERMMNEMMAGDGDVHFERNTPGSQDTASDVHLDIHEGDDEVRVVADIPGIEKEDIDLKCDGRTLHLDATGDGRTYREQISLPVPVVETSAQATYNNGVLEVVFDHDDDSTSIDI
ncbi:HSP20 family protein [Halovenus aranensis]|jgi:HSP20 family protein|uniref:HSP20 family protein n=1 Tax=Halovenus aranensis TaxID=890420 RepID=A0A1G8S7B7_9EURY|nr:Hsp20/alpha crystallin family protein [Halovenus aranensis]SDJ25097.1 HSP20 family protein [Halovenus aranensis]